MSVRGPKSGSDAVTGLSHLRVTFDERFYIGPGRADILDLIDKTGSISEAAKRMGMSYKRAWNLVQELNNGFGAPLVQSSRGGPDQGALLTPAGAEVLYRYRSMQGAARTAIEADFSAIQKLRSDLS
jgi:molybdate transport system regulatory protein